MKGFFKISFLFLVMTLSISQCNKTTPESFIDIPDTAFLNALFEAGVDENGDGQISIGEAEATSFITIWPSNVTDLTGIEAFINLDSLRIYMNPVTTIDISNNTALRFLECTGCQLSTLDISKNIELRHLDCSGGATMSNALTSLDVSGNRALESLICSENQLTALDISNNSALISLFCGRNQLSDLDVSNNTALTKLACNNNRLTALDISNNTALTDMISCGNQLISLDISNNTGLVKIGIDNMPTLHEVCVWTTPFPPSGVVILSDYSPNVYFTTACKK